MFSLKFNNSHAKLTHSCEHIVAPLEVKCCVAVIAASHSNVCAWMRGSPVIEEHISCSKSHLRVRMLAKAQFLDTKVLSWQGRSFTVFCRLS